MKGMIVRRFGAYLALLLILTGGKLAAPVFAQSANPTYFGDIAPLLSRSCVSCHRSGGSAPFALSSFIDAKRRATQLVQVTQSNFMPPWLPNNDGFANDRHLALHDKQLLKQWTLAGSPLGDKPGKQTELPSPPDWPLGTPDLIVTMPKAYTLTPNSLENTRCFLLPKPLKKDAILRAIAFRPQNPRIVRYVNLYEDRTGVGRKQEAISGAVGYFGFTGGLFPSPMGSLADWSPSIEVVTYSVGAGALGYRIRRQLGGMAYPKGVGVPLSKDSDLILQVRFHATGKAEQERMQVGLYFAKDSDDSLIEPVTLRIGKAELYLPKNSTANLTDSFVLPIDASLLEIVPNGHFSTRTIQVTADTPDGKSFSLLDIPDWNVDWKQPYRLAVPTMLPSGTKLTLRMTLDNTDDNPRNPAKPAHRIVPGVEFMEEMSSVWLRLIPTSSEDRDKLVAALPDPQHKPWIDTVEHDPPEGQPAPPRSRRPPQSISPP